MYNKTLKNNPVLSIFNSFLVDSRLRSNINYFYNGGSILGLCLALQLVTGIILAMFYIRDISLAFESVEYIFREVNFGWLLRYLHANGASLFFIFLYLHIGRGLYYGSYNYPRILVWFSGVIIFLLIMGIAFFGYVLPWGQMSYWAAQVITSMFGSIPVIGNSIVEVLWGGYSVDKPTLTRFFSLHFLMRFLVTGLVFIHLIALHVNGSGNRLGINSNSDKIPFQVYFSIKDLFGFTIVFLFLGFLVFYNPNYLGHPDNYIPANPNVTPLHIVREWYFLPFYAILRSVPNKVVGVLLMVGAILILLILRLFNLMRLGSTSLSPIYKVMFWFFVGNLLLLGNIGQLPVEYPWELFGKISTVIYFSIFLFVIPIIGFLEVWLSLS